MVAAAVTHTLGRRCPAAAWRLVHRCSLLLVLAGFVLACFGQELPVDGSSVFTGLSNAEKGFVGENLVDDFYAKAGRKSLLDKWNTVAHGPDRLYRLPDGRLEMHEVKCYSGWAGKDAMATTVNGRPVMELSDEWITASAERTIGNRSATAAEKELEREVLDQLGKGKLGRVYDEINLSTGQWRSSNVASAGANQVALQERAGPQSIARLKQRVDKQLARLAETRASAVTRSELLREGKIRDLKAPVRSFDGYKTAAERNFGECKVRPGLVTPEGRLLVSLGTGAEAGLIVFALDAGAAGYSYLKGDILKPEFERDVCDAAVKGTAVGGCTAVAVMLGAGPAGWVVLGVGFGSYIITDLALKEWHEYQDGKFLTLADLAAIIGPENISRNIPLGMGENTSPNIPLRMGE